MNERAFKDLMILVTWIVLVAAGFAGLSVYSKTQSGPSLAIAQWPTEIPRASARDTLVLFLHPRCSCSRATLETLEHLLPSLQGHTTVIVNFYYPSKEGESFAKAGSLWSTAQRLPGVDVRLDQDSRVAALFGARASGSSMYFAADGHLAFNGGLTPARGHVGDNSGRDAVVALARGQEPATSTSPIFGCQLSEDLRNEVALVQ